jgi:hypothetical protein
MARERASRQATATSRRRRLSSAPYVTASPLRQSDIHEITVEGAW